MRPARNALTVATEHRLSRRATGMPLAVFAVVTWVVSGMLVSYRPNLVIVGLLGSFLVALYLWREDLALFLLVAYTPFHIIMVAYMPASRLTGWKDAVIVVFFGLWAANQLLSDRRRRTTSKLDIPIACFLAIMAFNVLRTPSLLAGLAGVKWHANFIPLYFMVSTLDLSSRRLKLLLTMLLVLGAVNAAYGLGAVFGPREVFRLASRYTSDTEPGNIFAAHWLSVNVWAVLLLMGACLRSAHLDQRYQRIVTLTLPVLFGALVFSLLGAAWITLALGFLFLALLRQKRILAYMLLAILIVLALFPPYVVERAQTIVQATYISRFNKESRQIPIGLRAIADQPLGHGVGTLVSIEYQHLIGGEAINLLAGSIGGLENGMLEVGFELGIPGLVAYLGILLLPFHIGMRVYRSTTDEFTRWVTAGILAFCLMVLVGEGYVAYLKTVEAYYWAFLGVLVGLERVTIGGDHMSMERMRPLTVGTVH